MNVIEPLFVLAAIVVVPLGLRLAEERRDQSVQRAAGGVAGLAAGLLTVAQRLAMVAAPLLVLGYGLPRGLPAAIAAMPWLAVALLAAASAFARFVADPDRWRPSVEHAIEAALGFLLVGATFAVADRLGARPFGFSGTLILLTAVHFHVAGFGLLVAGARAWRVRPSRWLEASLGAVVVGAPLTALGFFGLPILNWVGAMLVAAGGLGIGLGHLAAAGRLAGTPRHLARLAGFALLGSMPLAVAYASASLAGVAGPSLAFMAAVHGSLNVVGFSIPAMLGWTLPRPSGRAASSTRPGAADTSAGAAAPAGAR